MYFIVMKKNLYDKVLNPKELISMPADVLNLYRAMTVVGHKNKKELEVWIMKNKMLYDLPFISVEQYLEIHNKLIP